MTPPLVPTRGSPAAPPRARWSLWMTLAALLPAPGWLLAHSLMDSGPVWRARYYDNTQLQGEPVERQERQLSHYWDREQPEALPGLDARRSSGRWDTCLHLDEPRQIPLMLVATGRASLTIDGEVALSLDAEKAREARGEELALGAGAHHLSVDFEARSWPSIGLLASLDGAAPQALGSRAAPGVELRLPARVGEPCP